MASSPKTPHPEGQTPPHGPGHHHHVISDSMLKRTFGILVALTVLTVVLAVLERGWGDFFGFYFEAPQIHFGPFSIVVALGIAGAKAYFVAANFMGLREPGNATNRLVLVGSTLFLVIFFSITYLDVAFRDTFFELSAVDIDVLAEQDAQAAEIQTVIQDRFDAEAVVEEADPALFGRTLPADTTAAPAN